MSFREIEEVIVHALVEENGRYYYWPVATYREQVIYEATERGDVEEGTKYWRRSWVANDSGTITLGEKTEVKREVQYVDAVGIEGGKVRLVRKGL